MDKLFGGNDSKIERNDGLSEGTAATSPMARRQTIIPFSFGDQESEFIRHEDNPKMRKDQESGILFKYV